MSERLLVQENNIIEPFQLEGFLNARGVEAAIRRLKRFSRNPPKAAGMIVLPDTNGGVPGALLLRHRPKAFVCGTLDPTAQGITDIGLFDQDKYMLTPKDAKAVVFGLDIDPLRERIPQGALGASRLDPVEEHLVAECFAQIPSLMEQAQKEIPGLRRGRFLAGLVRMTTDQQ